MTLYPVYGTPCPRPGYWGWLDAFLGDHKPTPEADYHRFSGIGGSFISKDDNWKSALHLRDALDADPVTPTQSMRLGSALHNLVAPSGDAEHSYVGGPDCDRRSNDNRERHRVAELEAEARGLPIIAPRDVPTAEAMYESIQANDDAMDLLSGPTGMNAHGMTEAVLTWREHGVMCKARADRIVINEPIEDVILVDIKSTKDASKKAFEKSIRDYGYDVQLAHYRSGLMHAPVEVDWWPERLARHYRDGFPIVPSKAFVRCAIIAVENVAPFGCSVIWLNESWLERGDSIRMGRLSMLNRAERRDEWPGYPTSYDSEPPAWALSREDQLTKMIREVARESV